VTLCRRPNERLGIGWTFGLRLPSDDVTCDFKNIIVRAHLEIAGMYAGNLKSFKIMVRDSVYGMVDGSDQTYSGMAMVAQLAICPIATNLTNLHQ
jgi:hypothetical protein